jgi:hypothetical protein
MEVLADVAEAEPRFLRKQFGLVFKLCNEVVFDKAIDD